MYKHSSLPVAQASKSCTLETLKSGARVVVHELKPAGVLPSVIEALFLTRPCGYAK